MKKIFVLLFILIGGSSFSQQNSVPPSSTDTTISFCCYTIKYYLGKDVVHYMVYEKKDSTLAKEYTQVRDTLHGVEQEYYTTGKIKSMRTYILGIPIGAYIKYNENGSIYSFYEYGYSPGDKNLSMNEFTVEYTRSEPPFDEITEIIQYYKPLNGKYYYYYENGKVQKVENYANNQLNGDTEYYNIDGKIFKIEEYKNGILERSYNLPKN